jgi:sugar-specific transcriptional regulator TrmB
LKSERDELKQRLEALESDSNARENAFNSRVNALEAAANEYDEQIVSCHWTILLIHSNVLVDTKLSGKLLEAAKK